MWYFVVAWQTSAAQFGPFASWTEVNQFMEWLRKRIAGAEFYPAWCVPNGRD